MSYLSCTTRVKVGNWEGCWWNLSLTQSQTWFSILPGFLVPVSNPSSSGSLSAINVETGHLTLWCWCLCQVLMWQMIPLFPGNLDFLAYGTLSSLRNPSSNKRVCFLDYECGPELFFHSGCLTWLILLLPHPNK